MIDRYLFRGDLLIATGTTPEDFVQERQLGDRMFCFNKAIQEGHKDYLWTSQRVYRYAMHDMGAAWFPLPDSEIPRYKALLLLHQ